MAGQVVVDGLARDGAVHEALYHHVVRVGVVHGGEGVKQRIAALVGAPQPLNLGAQVVLGLPPGVVEDALQAGLLAPFAGILAIALKWSEGVSMRSSHGYNSGCVGHGHPDGKKGRHGEDSDGVSQRLGTKECVAARRETPVPHPRHIHTHSPWPVFSCSAGRPFEPGVVGALLLLPYSPVGNGSTAQSKASEFHVHAVEKRSGEEGNCLLYLT